jgi:hypothetical protein
MKHRSRILAAFVLAVAALSALTLTAGAASAATVSPGTPRAGSAPLLQPSSYTANGTPVYHLTPGAAAAALPHACAALGGDGTNQAVECADVVTDGTYIYPQVEGMCQSLSNSSSFPQCADVHLNFALYEANVGYVTPTVAGLCGHANGSCVSGGRNYFYYTNVPLGVGSGQCVEVWTVLFSGSTIELPVSAQTKTSGSNLGSGHAVFCA